ncbi:MAG: MFS transporter [Candidatus Eisenbacteria sp.]|nr:MFS transporter [Candidatus Eisenbacteria bacterium]
MTTANPDPIEHREPQTPKRYPHSRRNFTLGLLNGIFMRFAYSFADSQTVLPVFVIILTESPILAGIVAGLFEAGWYLPQIFVSNLVQHRERKLPLYRAMAYVRAASWVAAAVSVFLIGARSPSLVFWAFFLCYLGVCLGAGTAAISFMDIVGKSFPPQRRGSFFAYRRLIGGLLGIGAGMVVARVLSPGSGLAFPHNYSVIFGFTAVFAVAGLASFSMVKEPIEPVSPARVRFRDHLRSCGRILQEDTNYRRYFTQRVLASLSLMALPFYATYAVTVLGAETAQVGVMVSLWMLSGMLSNALWGTLSDRKGSRVLVVASSALAVIPPIVALGSFLVPSRPIALPPVLSFWLPECLCEVDLRLLVFLSCFVLNGFSDAARKVSISAYLLDISPALLRPTYVGLMNTISSPLALAPALGGLITQMFSYRAVFSISLVFALLAFGVSLRLAEAKLPGPGEHEIVTRAT